MCQIEQAGEDGPRGPVPPAAPGVVLDRRRFLSLLALGAAACSSGEPGTLASPSAAPSTEPVPSPSASPTAPPPSPEPSPSPSPSPTTPQLARWEPSAAELTPNLKVLATEVVHTLLDHGPDADPLALAAAVLPAGEDRQALVAVLAPLVVPGRSSRVRVIYPQLSGYSDPRLDNAARRDPLPEPEGGWPFKMSGIMALVEHVQGTDDEPQVTTRVLDLRFTQDTETAGWRFTGMPDVGGVPIERPADVTPAAAAVLDDPRIDLPDSARWDIHRGIVDDRLLEIMELLAARTPYGVLVLQSGHPPNVFNTDRVSNHTNGRAVDIWRLGDVDVIDDRLEGSPSYMTVEFIYDLEELVRNIGSPWDLDPIRGRSFTDFVHLDHLHVAVGPPALDAEA